MEIFSSNNNQFTKPKIWMVPVPLGAHSIKELLNPEYVAVVRDTKAWVVENTRTIRRFFSSLHLGLVIDEIQFFELHKDYSAKELDAFLEKHIQNGNIGCCSEAGLPGMADPGSIVAMWGHTHGIEVSPLNGPGSIPLSLMASGLNGQQFTFHGYPPIKEDQLKPFLQDIGKQTLQKGYTQICIEAPYRSDRLLQYMLANLPSELYLCIAFNLQNPDGWIRTKTITAWKKDTPILGKTPCVFLIGRPDAAYTVAANWELP